MQRKTKILIPIFLCVITVGAVVASAISNYIFPVHINITSSPGITVYNSDTQQPLSSIEWGDIQRTMSKSFKIYIANTQGSTTLYIRDSSFTYDRDLSAYGTLVWDYTTQCVGYSNIPLPPGQRMCDLTITFTASSDAPTGLLGFDIIIWAYDTPSG
jgi:hypothetical protein